MLHSCALHLETTQHSGGIGRNPKGAPSGARRPDKTGQRPERRHLHWKPIKLTQAQKTFFKKARGVSPSGGAGQSTREGQTKRKDRQTTTEGRKTDRHRPTDRQARQTDGQRPSDEQRADKDRRTDDDEAPTSQWKSQKLSQKEDISAGRTRAIKPRFAKAPSRSPMRKNRNC